MEDVIRYNINKTQRTEPVGISNFVFNHHVFYFGVLGEAVLIVVQPKRQRSVGN